MSVAAERKTKISRPAILWGKFKYNLKEMKKNWELYLFLLPYFIFFIVFVVLPVVIAIILGFTSFNALSAPKFVFLDNYTRMFLSDELFVKALKNTIMFAVVVGPGGYILCLFFAWMVNELSPRVRAIMTLVFYAPSLANLTKIWKILFSSDEWGLLNSLLVKWGMEPIAWLESSQHIFPVLCIILLWSSLSYSFLSFIAGLQGVDRSLYEAASVDGIRNRWQELWYITLPFIKPHLLFAAVMSLTNAFGSIGPQIDAIAGRPSYNYEAHTLPTHVLDYATERLEIGYACAVATILFILMVVSNKLAQKFLSKVGE